MKTQVLTSLFTLRSLQTVCWLAFLGYVIFSGLATRYVIAWQVWLLLASFVVLALGLLLRQWDSHGCDDDHSHAHEKPTWSETGVHALPLVLFMVIGPTVLGTHALGDGGMFDSSLLRGSAGALVADADGYRRTDLLALRHDPFLAGGKVTLTARLGELTEQTTRRRRNGPEPIPKPVLFRHVISCCAADGRPIYTWIAEQTPIDLPLDSWIVIHGIVDVRETGGVVPVIHVERWKSIPEPKEPYLVVLGAVKKHD